MRKIILRWNQFWFENVDLQPVCLFRCLLSCTLFVMYLIRFQDRDILHYENGLLTSALAKEFLPDFYRAPFSILPTSDNMVLLFSLGLLAGLLLLSFGLINRFATWIVLFLHLSLIERNYTVIYGADLIASVWLFYLGFINHTQAYSLRKTQNKKDLLSSMGLRLLQIQLCVIYGYSGLEKLKGTAWWDGSAVWKVLTNEQLAPIDFHFLSHAPSFLALTTMLTVIFEVYFPVIVWIPILRRVWLLVGLSFHIAAALFMGLPFFSIVMGLSYLVFLTNNEMSNLNSVYFKPMAATIFLAIKPSKN